MSEKLFNERVELAKAYSAANDAIAEVREKCATAKQAIVEFDKVHPEIMLAVKEHANKEKKACRDAEIAAAFAAAEAEAEREGGDA